MVFYIWSNKSKASSVLLLHYKESEDNTKDQTQHYSGYDISKLKLNQNKIKTAILEEIIKQKEKHENNEQINQKENEINILVWNANSLKDYTKKLFLIETMLVNKIHIALIQETMLKDKDKMYIKGYRIYRSNSEFRRGTAIMVSNIIKA